MPCRYGFRDSGRCSLFGLKAGSGAISGTITIAGYPVAGVTVTAGSASATTDSSGKYTITGLSDGSYKVTPGKSNYSFSPASSTVTLSGPTGASGIDFDSGPALPVPTSYTENLPSESNPIFVKEVPLTVSFSPTLYGGYLSSNVITPLVISGGCTGGCSASSITVPQWIAGCAGMPSYPTGGPPVWAFEGDDGTPSQRISLIDSSGNIVSNPQAKLDIYPNESQSSGDCTGGGSYVPFEFTLEPLTQKPILELTAFWKLLSANRYAADTVTTYSQTVTYGVTQTSTTAFTNTFNASAGFNIGAVKTTLSYTFSSTVTNSMSITQTTSTTNSYSVNPGNKEGVLAIWQLVYQIAAVLKATPSEITAGHDQFGNPVDSYGYVAFSDPSFVQHKTDVLDATDVAPLDIQQEADIVPEMTLFTP